MSKCLFFICGEGRGHSTQAIALKQILDKLDIELASAYIGRGNIAKNNDWVFNELKLKSKYFYSPKTAR
jgi:galactitol-specific phosphotransferase system IIB component